MAQQQSRQALEWLHYVDREIHRIEHAGNVGESRLRHGFENFLVDGFDPETNTVYEFHGCLYHGCPSCYTNRKQKHRKHNGLTCQGVYEKTLDKTKKLRNLGYIVIEKWGCLWQEEKTNDPRISGYVETLKIENHLTHVGHFLEDTLTQFVYMTSYKRVKKFGMWILLVFIHGSISVVNIL